MGETHSWYGGDMHGWWHVEY